MSSWLKGGSLSVTHLRNPTTYVGEAKSWPGKSSRVLYVTSLRWDIFLQPDSRGLRRRLKMHLPDNFPAWDNCRRVSVGSMKSRWCWFWVATAECWILKTCKILCFYSSHWIWRYPCMVRTKSTSSKDTYKDLLPLFHSSLSSSTQTSAVVKQSSAIIW